RRCLELLEQYRQPVLVEPFLAGREFTTGITGEGDQATVVGTLEIVLLEGRAEAHAYTYTNKIESDDRVAFPLAPEPWAGRCGGLALAAGRALGCRDAGRVDLRADAAGNLMVLEANPLPGMRPGYSDLPVLCERVGVTYVELVRRILDGAFARA